ncbi:Hypothetical_protein [Hexamita inflata]|uniref:Hypothetical_protein n=1 Tax=Hexamita inflata TaxID=28002 RepID=A0AA86PTM7_9EUKA|nr:Hypothetical protein HINF_LOCUS32261 [Hexamita inflata]
MKGKRKYFNDEKGIDEYQNATKIDDELVQLFCKVYYEQGSTKYQFGYVTKNGDTLIEYPQFDYKFGYFGTGIPKNVKQIIVGTCTTFALTNTGLYVLGLCSEACGLVDKLTTQVLFQLRFPSQLQKLNQFHMIIYYLFMQRTATFTLWEQITSVSHRIYFLINFQ